MMRRSAPPPGVLQAGPVWLRALVAGLAMAASVPPWGWWPLGFVGLAVWVELLADTPWTQRAAVSALVSVSWIAPATVWMVDFSPVGWLLTLAGFAAMHAAAGAVTPGDTRRWAGFVGAFTLVELFRWTVPFGGVPLATMSLAQVAGPLGGTARIGGAILVTALAATVGVSVAAMFGRQPAGGLVALVLVALLALAADSAPGAEVVTSEAPNTEAGSLASTGEPNAAEGGELAEGSAVNIRVAAVQGGGPQNTRADVCAQRGVFERHLSATRTQVNADVDLIVWPEDVVHLSPVGSVAPSRCADQTPVTQPEAEAALAAVARQKNATLVAGFFNRAPDGDANLNYVLAYSPTGTVTGEYHKHRLVPFGEYVPLRSWAERFSDELPGRDVRPGDAQIPAVVDSPVGRLGVVISWEVFFSGRARSAIRDGQGQVLLNPTNGSSYWLTVVQSQQVAASRLRAIETDRWVVQAAPTGFSAIIDPGGTVIERTGVSETRVLEATVQMRRGDTLAGRFGAWPTSVVAVLVLAWALGAFRLLVDRRAR